MWNISNVSRKEVCEELRKGNWCVSLAGEMEITWLHDAEDGGKEI